MDQKTKELINTALRNRKEILYKTFIIEVDNRKYFAKINGVGRKTIPCTIWIDYNDILNNKDVGIEKILYKLINTVY